MLEVVALGDMWKAKQWTQQASEVKAPHKAL